MTQTLEQKRAAYALGHILGDEQKKIAPIRGQAYAGKYKSLVQGFSAMVLHNGLGQSVAFLMSKGEDEHNRLINDLTNWVVEDQGVFNNGGECDSYIDCIVNNDRERYVRATEETLLLVDWLAKFANAFIESDKEKKDADTDS